MSPNTSYLRILLRAVTSILQGSYHEVTWQEESVNFRVLVLLQVLYDSGFGLHIVAESPKESASLQTSMCAGN